MSKNEERQQVSITSTKTWSGPLFLMLGLIFSTLSPAFADSKADENQQGRVETNDSEFVWKGPGGKPLPFNSREEIEDFLRTALIVSMKDIPLGVTKPRKVLLEKDGVQAYAAFRDVDIYRQNFNDAKGFRPNFKDKHIYECAAYEVSKILGLDNVPPTVPRKIHGKDGSLQIWVEDALMDKDRREKNIDPPSRERWMKQLQVMATFDNLIFNDDRNQGNILFSQDWELFLIDHTRSFRTYSSLPEAKEIKNCEKNLWKQLTNLDESVVKSRLEDYLTKKEINSLLKRASKLRELIQELIDERGEDAVLFTLL